MSQPQPTDAERLKAIKVRFWRWANSPTYALGCANWRALCEVIGYDVATDLPVERETAKEPRAPGTKGNGETC